MKKLYSSSYIFFIVSIPNCIQ